jgi:GAF domain-containing protein
MGRGPAKAKARAKLPVAGKTRTDKHLTEALKREEEALEQQTATAEILSIISSSPADAQPVFDAIAVNALRLCDAKGAVVVRYDGELLHVVAHHNVNPEAVDRLKRQYPGAPDRHHPTGRAVLDGTVVQVPDLQATEEFSGSVARQFGARGHVSIPLLHRGRAIGAIGISRPTLGPFSDRQIALLQTFAAQAVIAIENARQFQEQEAGNRDLREALEQQTATAEILRLIGTSPTDAQPVFEAIARSGVTALGALSCAVFIVEGDTVRVAATHNVRRERVERFRTQYPAPFSSNPEFVTAVREGIFHLADIEHNPNATPEEVEFGRLAGYRTRLMAPMMRGDSVLGIIAVTREAPAAFSERQVELLKTFADQAVIAIENVRLFTETKEALEQQRASGEILGVISSSPTDVQPVFDVIVQSAVRLCGGLHSNVYRVEADLIHLVAHHNFSPEALEHLQRRFPIPVSRGEGLAARVIREGIVVHLRDAQTDPEVPETTRRITQALGARSVLYVPMLRDRVGIGVIVVSRSEVKPFSDKEIALIRTFADQAVIAIENVRLFTELQEKNRALTEAHGRVTEALEQQTATSEILRTIAQAQADVQPVFDTIVQSAARLCHAANAAVFLTDGRMVYEPANFGGSPAALAATRARFPRPVGMDSTPGIAILTRSVFHVPDTEAPSVIEHLRQSGRLAGFRSAVTVPMLREGEAVGAILVARRSLGPFSDAEVELLKTFADQAVIAVENVRLFKELEARTAALTRSVEQLTALGEVGRAVSSTLDLETVLTTIVSRAVQLSGLDGGVVLEYDEGAEEFVQRAQAETGGALAAARRATRIRKGEGVVGQTAITLEPVQVPDITLPGAYVGPNRENLIESGIRAIVAVPMVREGQLIGCLGVTRNRSGEFPAETIELLRTFATQSALAIQNARLFHEIEDKSRQLEAASRHKSEFLANMSHELRTPLNAIIGFSEVLGERMFGDLNEKQEEYLKDIHASGQHLLSLINDILDLSKIEAGRMELELTEFDLPTAIDNALTLVRERAGRRGISLHQSAGEGLGQIRGDERKIKQVLLNLLSNAIKFTPDGGRIDVRATAADGSVEVSVTDTGVGIAPEDQEAIFEEFRQVGTAAKKMEGTGLGLALSRKFIELHGGRIWVASEVGRGSTFTLTLPLRPPGGPVDGPPG